VGSTVDQQYGIYEGEYGNEKRFAVEIRSSPRRRNLGNDKVDEIPNSPRFQLSSRW
jgi:hypothetical protein